MIKGNSEGSGTGDSGTEGSGSFCIFLDLDDAISAEDIKLL